MEIIHGYPPNFSEIVAAFPLARGSRVIFCYGPTIYNPNRLELTESLVAHEAVHAKQHGTDPEGWWRRYIVDRKFRFDQEVTAHAAEYLVASRGMARPGRRLVLRGIAERLALPLYGLHTTKERAAKLMIEAARNGNC